MIPSSTAGTPSMTKSQRQPSTPKKPCRPSRAPESGPPNTVAMGTAVMNSDTMRARSAFGNQ